MVKILQYFLMGLIWRKDQLILILLWLEINQEEVLYTFQIWTERELWTCNLLMIIWSNQQFRNGIVIQSISTIRKNRFLRLVLKIESYSLLSHLLDLSHQKHHKTKLKDLHLIWMISFRLKMLFLMLIDSGHEGITCLKNLIKVYQWMTNLGGMLYHKQLHNILQVELDVIQY